MNRPQTRPQISPRIGALLQQAFAMNAQGRLNDAAKAAKQVLKVVPKEPHALYLLGVVAHRTGDLRAAAKHFEKAHNADKSNPAAISGIGIVKMDQERYAEAARYFEKALKLMPNDAPTHNNLGLALRRLGRLDQARTHFEAALRADPAYATAYLNLGEIMGLSGDYDRAIAFYRRGLKYAPTMAELHFNLGNALASLQRPKDAIECYRTALKHDPDSRNATVVLAGAQIADGDIIGAEATLREHLKRVPDDAPAWVDLWEILRTRSDPESKEEATRILESTIQMIDGGADRRWTAALARTKFAKALEAVGRYDDAFSHYKAAQDFWLEEQESVGLVYDQANTEAFVDHLIDYHRMHPPGSGGGMSTNRPIFIVGMPRSGTSLLEQVLASHPAIFGAGELLEMPDIAQELMEDGTPLMDAVDALDDDARQAFAQRYLDRLDTLDRDRLHVTDKLPANYYNVGLIRALFPNALVLHIERDPVDVCLSIYFQKFDSDMRFDHDLRSIGHNYRQYRRLANFWQVWDDSITTVRYENLVDNPRAVVEPLLGRLDLEWDAAMERFYESDRKVVTASRMQVRRPLYKTSVAKWKRYEAYLQPLLDALGPDAHLPADPADGDGTTQNTSDVSKSTDREPTKGTTA